MTSLPRPSKAFGVPIPYSASVPELRAHLAVPGPKAWAACLALGCKPEKEACDLLVELAGRDWNYRNLAIQSLGVHPLGATAAAAIIGALSDSVSQVARTACDAAAKLKLSAARPRLLKMLDDVDAQVRFHAVRALGAIWTGEDFGRVWELFKKDKAEFVRQEAAVVLRSTVTRKTWRHLFDRWKRDPLPKCRVWACELLSAFGRPDDMPELQRLVRDGSVHVRRAAEKAAVERGVS